MKLTGRAIFILLLITCASSATLGRSKVISMEADLDGDGRTERISLDKESASASLSVRRGGRLLWQGVPARWKPWKLAVADVDGDGRGEIVVGVYKSTRFFPKPHNCLFIYSWDGRRAHPKWLGSSLSKPFVDFAFLDANGKSAQELLSIETKRDGRQCLALYAWNGFGFTLEGQRGDWREAKLVETTRGRIIVEADGARIAFSRTEIRNNL
jgi:hypothetical protein